MADSADLGREVGKPLAGFPDSILQSSPAPAGKVQLESIAFTHPPYGFQEIANTLVRPETPEKHQSCDPTQSALSD